MKRDVENESLNAIRTIERVVGTKFRFVRIRDKDGNRRIKVCLGGGIFPFRRTYLARVSEGNLKHKADVISVVLTENENETELTEYDYLLGAIICCGINRIVSVDMFGNQKILFEIPEFSSACELSMKLDLITGRK